MHGSLCPVALSWREIVATLYCPQFIAEAPDSRCWGRPFGGSLGCRDERFVFGDASRCHGLSKLTFLRAAAGGCEPRDGRAARIDHFFGQPFQLLTGARASG